MKLIPTGDGPTLEIGTDQPNVIVGRKPRRGLVVPDPTVSREHARLFQRDGTWFVADLNSSNGTFLDGTRVTRGELSHGALLRLGQVEFRVDLGTGPMPDRPAVEDALRDDDAEPREAPGRPGRTATPAAAPIESPPGDDEIVLEEPSVAPSAAGPAATAPSSDRTVLVGRAPPAGRGAAPPTAGAPRPKALEHLDVRTRSASRAGGSILEADVSQYGFLHKMLLVALVLAVCAGLFLAVMKLTEEVVPEGGVPPPAVEEKDF